MAVSDIGIIFTKTWMKTKLSMSATAFLSN
jgi:hypothetical protein